MKQKSFASQLKANNLPLSILLLQLLKYLRGTVIELTDREPLTCPLHLINFIQPLLNGAQLNALSRYCTN